jgi:hypothetical protein
MGNPPAQLDSDFFAESLLRAGEFHLDPDEYGGVEGIGGGDSDGRGGALTPSTVASRFQAAARSARVFKKAEAETVRRVLDEIDMIGLKRSTEGLCEFNFSVGVYNCVRIVLATFSS